MKRVLLLSGILALGVVGCKKASPTAFIKAISMYLNDYDGQQSSLHRFYLLTTSPNYKPTIMFNNRTVPDDRIDASLGDYTGWDTLPSVSPNTEVELKVTYYNLNDEKKEASSKVKLPAEPAGMALSISGGEVNVSWNKPDKATTDFVYVGIYAGCTDGSSTQYAFVDTVITDIENVTSVSRTLGSICDEISNILAASVYAGVYNMKGPWGGSKDNVKGAKGQYYGGAGKADTTSYMPTKGNYNLSIPEVDWSSRILNALGGPVDGGEWIER